MLRRMPLRSWTAIGLPSDCSTDSAVGVGTAFWSTARYWSYEMQFPFMNMHWNARLAAQPGAAARTEPSARSRDATTTARFMGGTSPGFGRRRARSVAHGHDATGLIPRLLVVVPPPTTFRRCPPAGRPAASGGPCVKPAGSPRRWGRGTQEPTMRHIAHATALVVCALAAGARADDVVTKTGKTYTGTIVAEDENSVTVDTKNLGQMKVAKVDIAKITRADAPKKDAGGGEAKPAPAKETEPAAGAAPAAEPDAEAERKAFVEAAAKA